MQTGVKDKAHGFPVSDPRRELHYMIDMLMRKRVKDARVALAAIDEALDGGRIDLKHLAWAVSMLHGALDEEGVVDADNG